MKWIEASIYTTTNGIELINGTLIKLGINDAVIEDASVFQDFLNSEKLNWDYYDEDLAKMANCESCIKVYLADNNQGKDLLNKVYEAINNFKYEPDGFDLGRLDIELRMLDDEDWANNWKKYFKPFVVSNKIIIKPSWEEYNEPTDGKIVLQIDPGMSFGTGQHHTTRLCIEQIEKHLTPDMNILDMGCGSGILSIASILLGAKSVTGVDIDENAVRIAKENAELNGIYEDRLKLFVGDVTSDQKLQDEIGYKRYDMIAVNIIADIIIGMSHTFPKFLKDGGLVVASGIIKKYLPDIVDNFVSLGFEVLEVNEREDWVSVTAKLMQ
jgi:ribosomal protein L11 methyltransferase